jgi:methyl-accepting chemotaxis protein
MRLGLKNKFLLPTILLVLIGLVTSTYYSVSNSSQALRESSEAQIAEIANATSLQIDSWLKDRLTDMAYWASNPQGEAALNSGNANQADDLKAYNALLERAAQTYPAFQRVHLLNEKGIAHGSSHAKYRGKLDLSSRGYFQKGMQGETVISKILISKATGKPVIVLASPVKDAGGGIKGVLAGVVDLGVFTATVIDRIKVGAMGYAYLVNSQGVVVAHPDKKQIQKLDLSKLDFGKKILAASKGIIRHQWQGSGKLSAFEKIPAAGWLVVVQADEKEVLASSGRLAWINAAIGLGLLLLTAVTIFLVAGTVTKPINRTVAVLSGGASEISGASTEVSNAAQQLAVASSQQASALEETSASLEELTSMTSRNTDHASQADALMQDTQSVVSQATSAMGELKQAMQTITVNSSETAKIIKTIDEIAFQTNLLALNAAVEAARAGESGAGFAVVADEVRSLAMRAAEAAKNTTQMIEGNIANIKKGHELVTTTDEAFNQVRESSRKAGSLISEIASASFEQNQGISQINQSTSSMDNITQQVAAHSEESAAASEQLRAQANAMQGVVKDLCILVSGASRKEAAPRAKGKAVSGSASPKLISGRS